MSRARIFDDCYPTGSAAVFTSWCRIFSIL
jgi:hypothetical protein